MKYQHHFDGIRAICIILTVLNHVPGAPSYILGNVGVDIFFGLSGWLITHLLFLENARHGRVSLKAFYIRRFFRIVPLYALTLVLYGLAAVALATLAHQRAKLDAFMAALPYLATFNGEFAPAAAGKVFGHAWTLAIEEKFYIFWPPMFLALWPRARWPALLACFAALLAAACVVQDTQIVRGYVGLGCGAAAALLAANHPATARRLLAGKGLYCALAMALVYACGLASKSALVNVAMGVASVFLIASLHYDGAQPMSRLLSVRPLAYLGKLTYGIYLIHILVLNATLAALPKLIAQPAWWQQFIACYALSVLLAAVLQRLVETPLIALGRRLAARAGAGPGAAERAAPL